MAATLRELTSAGQGQMPAARTARLHTSKGAAANSAIPHCASSLKRRGGRIDAPDLETELAARVAELTTLETRADAA